MKSTYSLKSTFNSAFVLFLGFAIISTTGCLGGLAIPGTALPTEPPPAAESAGQYQVEMLGSFSRQSAFRGEIDGPITVQEALERSGATRKFRSMDIMLLRVVEKTGRPLRLEVRYTPRTKSVKPEENYAIHPNDRIMVRAKSINAIDKLVDSLNPNN